ncbi:RNA chaperone ProQ [Thalassotalea euphylliae]|uniref:RNA chaperone ProQ n=1 Tax=Thalassotalea euphylliae TaxID=1655234 RepID=A0A3E0UHX7_9GAMM|nr:RNA chaperone ProQ [Thalassotalea euphylliae]REL35785.1 RNA chaperone ProQ [Thalassotalea euphylliae]
METKRTSSKEIIAYLAEKFPACFSIEGAAKPLKIGIFQDLAEQLSEDETVSKTRLRQALRHYTSSWRYLKSIKVGSHRVDLAGNNAEAIDEAQAEYAAKTLKESQDKFANKKQQDNKDKKPYKGKKNNNAQATGDNKRSQKFKAVKSPTKRAPKPAVELKPVESTTIKVNQQVKVRIGQAPMNATITEVAGDDISVQLDSGMVIKTHIQNIFSE